MCWWRNSSFVCCVCVHLQNLPPKINLPLLPLFSLSGQQTCRHCLTILQIAIVCWWSELFPVALHMLFDVQCRFVRFCPLSPSLSNRRDMLRSLILSGAAMKDWIRVLATITEMSLVDLQLQCLWMQGTGKLLVLLSHASILFVHQLLYLNPLMELMMQNVCLQDEKDSEVHPGLLRFWWHI